MNKKKMDLECKYKIRRKGRTCRQRVKKRSYPREDLYSLPNCCIKLKKFLTTKGLQKDKSVASLDIYNAVGKERGLRSKYFIDANTIIMRIPYKALITCHTVVEDEVLGSLILSSCKTFRATDILSLFLLYERTKESISDWSPFMESLPTTYSVLSYCKLAEVRMLPYFLQKIHSIYEEKLHLCFNNLSEIWEKLLKSGRVSARLKFCDIKWAWFTVNTRCIYIKEPDARFLLDENTSALAPYLDLLNHSFDSLVTSKFNKSSNSFEIMTLKSYKTYDQVFINYGPHNNLKLLADYGFILQSNPHDCVEILLHEVFVTFEKENVLPCRRVSIQEKKQIIKKNFSLQVNINSENHSWNLEVVATILLMTTAELMQWKEVYKNIYFLPSHSLGLDLIRSLAKRKLEIFEKNLCLFAEVETPSDAFNMVKMMFKEYCTILQKYLQKKVL